MELMKVDISTDFLEYFQKILLMNEQDLLAEHFIYRLLRELLIRVPVYESETITHVISTISDPRKRFLFQVKLLL